MWYFIIALLMVTFVLFYSFNEIDKPAKKHSN